MYHTIHIYIYIIYIYILYKYICRLRLVLRRLTREEHHNTRVFPRGMSASDAWCPCAAHIALKALQCNCSGNRPASEFYNMLLYIYVYVFMQVCICTWLRPGTHVRVPAESLSTYVWRLRDPLARLLALVFFVISLVDFT